MLKTIIRMVTIENGWTVLHPRALVGGGSRQRALTTSGQMERDNIHILVHHQVPLPGGAPKLEDCHVPSAAIPPLPPPLTDSPSLT